MVEIKHSPQLFTQNHYTIIGTEMEELAAYCLLKIREQSRAFYSKDLRTNLLESGKTIIDVHAGMGNFYEVILINS
jgi:hypothetical protein